MTMRSALADPSRPVGPTSTGMRPLADPDRR